MLQPYTSANANKRGSIFFAILLTGLLAGTLDAAAAVVHYMIATGKNPIVIFPYIASGVFGKAAFSGNSIMIFWGFVFHYLIAFIFTIFFFLLYPRVKILAANIFITGLVYGLFAWLVMNLLVLPVSNIPKSTFDLKGAITGVIILMFCIGMPIALMAKNFYKRN
jgi:hypothetical protein